MRWGRNVGAAFGAGRAPRESCRDASFESSAPEWPAVSVVIPTRDHAELLAECVRGLEETTDYPQFEVVVVDNGSTACDALALLRDLRARSRFTVLERPGPFNFSALSNDGAGATGAPMLVFLNNDIAMLKNDWLR